MPNMSYCRFHNTLSVLIDCRDALEDKDLKELSSDERKDAINLIKLCQKIADEFSDDVENIELFGVDDDK
jgi:hypothetical protein